MKAQEIRQELDQLLTSGGAVPVDLQRLSREWSKAKLTTLPAYFEVIESRLRELRHELAGAENIRATFAEIWPA